ncbi:hypothetical protein BDR26DRAFT_856473 [Obelidium mucronatum]|nr:hypothetical protein BDR26DRAFT_856473 [Obelidium mucronatum]
MEEDKMLPQKHEHHHHCLNHLRPRNISHSINYASSSPGMSCPFFTAHDILPSSSPHQANLFPPNNVPRLSGSVLPTENIVERVRLTLSNSTLTEEGLSDEPIEPDLIEPVINPPKRVSRPRTAKLAMFLSRQTKVAPFRVSPTAVGVLRRMGKSRKIGTAARGGKRKLFFTTSKTKSSNDTTTSAPSLVPSTAACRSRKRGVSETGKKPQEVALVVEGRPLLPDSSPQVHYPSNQHGSMVEMAAMIVSSPIDTTEPGCSPTLHAVKRQSSNSIYKRQPLLASASKSAAFFANLRRSSGSNGGGGGGGGVGALTMMQYTVPSPAIGDGPIKSRLRNSKLYSHQIDTPNVSVPSLCGSSTPNRSTGGSWMSRATNESRNSSMTCAGNKTLFTSMDMHATHTTPNTRRILRDFECGKVLQEEEANPFL